MTDKDNNEGLAATMTFRENAGVKFTLDGETIDFKDMTRGQQIKVVNAFGGFYELFYHFIKEE